jgi:hypothetical protein
VYFRVTLLLSSSFSFPLNPVTLPRWYSPRFFATPLPPFPHAGSDLTRLLVVLVPCSNLQLVWSAACVTLSLVDEEKGLPSSITIARPGSEASTWRPVGNAFSFISFPLDWKVADTPGQEYAGDCHRCPRRPKFYLTPPALEDESPYPEVRSADANTDETDDPSTNHYLPCLNRRSHLGHPHSRREPVLLL